MPRLRFGLRTLAAAVLVTAAFQKRSLAESISQKGGSIFWSDPQVSLIPSLVARRLPREYCCTPLNIDTVGVSENELASIVRLFPSVESIGLERPKLGEEGLSYLPQLKFLKEVRIYAQSLPNLSQLGACKRLVKLDIDSLDFDDDRLAALKEISSLKMVMLFRTPVTPQGLSLVKDKIPDCEIVVFRNGHDDSNQSATLQYDQILKEFIHIEVSTNGAVREYVTPSAK